MKVLDIGCGWGGAAKHFSSNYGVKEIKRRENLLKKWSYDPSKIKVFDVPNGGSSIESTYEEVSSIIPAVDRLTELTNYEK